MYQDFLYRISWDSHTLTWQQWASSLLEFVSMEWSVARIHGARERNSLFGFSFGMFYIVCVLRDGGLVLFSITFFKMDKKNNNSAAVSGRGLCTSRVTETHLITIR